MERAAHKPPSVQQTFFNKAIIWMLLHEQADILLLSERPSSTETFPQKRAVTRSLLINQTTSVSPKNPSASRRASECAGRPRPDEDSGVYKL